MVYAPTGGWNGGEEKRDGRRENDCMFAVFLFAVYVLFDISCYCCLFCRVVYVVGQGAGFVKRGVVVGGGFRPLRVLRTRRPAGCLEFR